MGKKGSRPRKRSKSDENDPTRVPLIPMMTMMMTMMTMMMMTMLVLRAPDGQEGIASPEAIQVGRERPDQGSTGGAATRRERG
jgi:biopolymer transport protein ExbD